MHEHIFQGYKPARSVRPLMKIVTDHNKKLKSGRIHRNKKKTLLKLFDLIKNNSHCENIYFFFFCLLFYPIAKRIHSNEFKWNENWKIYFE